MTLDVYSVLELKRSGMTYKQISIKFGVTPQYVQLSLVPRGIVRRQLFIKYNYCCADCGKNLKTTRFNIHHISYDNNYNELDNLALLCTPCHMKRHRKHNHNMVCNYCGTEFISPNRRKYCSSKCRYLDSWTLLHCSYCGEGFYMRNSYYRRRMKNQLRNKPFLSFCGKKCQGRWLGGRFNSQNNLEADKYGVCVHCGSHYLYGGNNYKLLNAAGKTVFYHRCKDCKKVTKIIS